MIERAYTVKEIDALRRAHDNRYLYGRYGGPVYVSGQSGSMSRSYTEAEKTATVEQLVRTSMLAGHTAEDLLESEK